MDKQRLEEEKKTVDRLLEENKELRDKVTELTSVSESVNGDLEAMKQKLKKVEFERDSCQNQVECLKQNIKKLNKELHDEKQQNKIARSRLTELESCQTEGSSKVIQSPAQMFKQQELPQASEENKGKDLQVSLREAAEQTMAQTGFVYDDRTGLYYDWSSGYYYDPNSRLYYDNHSGTYYYFDQESNTYKFHSQVDLQTAVDNKLGDDEVKENVCADEKGSINEPITLDDSESEGEIREIDDDGECDDDLDESSSVHVDQDVVIVTQVVSAPCIRAIVTCSSTLKVGTLFIVTCQGGTLGRDKDVGHVIRMPDIELSKKHCLIEYDQTRRQYFIIDCGSKNGTFLNGQRLSESQESSADHVLTHGDNLTVGGTTLLLHVHQGNDTCDECEPGQVQAQRLVSDTTGEVSITKIVAASPKTYTLSLDERRKKQLKKLKKGYLLENSNYSVESQDITNEGKYKDRATVRRTKVGSDLPVKVPDAAPASVHRPIDSDNKGRKMLEKMGWKHGEGLGREGGGRKEPVTVQLRESSRGLGAGIKRSLDDTGAGGSRTYLLAKTRERFARINASSNRAKETRTFPATQAVYRGKGRPIVTPALAADTVALQEDRAPMGTQEDRAPVGTREDRVPVGTREDRAPVGTRKDRALVGTREDHGEEYPSQQSTREPTGSNNTAKDVDIFAE